MSHFVRASWRNGQLLARRLSFHCFATLIAALLAACGGGGGSGGGSGPGPTPSPDIAITAQPTDQATVDGIGVIFSVGADGDASFQWQRLEGSTWTDVAGANSASMATGIVRTADSGTRFRVIVTSRANPSNRLTSSVATLTVGPVILPPTIVAQPADSTLVAGQAAILSVTAGGTTPSLQWQRSADGSTWFDVTGATSTTLTLPGVTALDDGAQFRAVLSNPGGTVTSAVVTLHVAAAPTAPVFTLNPSAASVVAGDSVTFSATAVGMPAPTLKWQTSLDQFVWADVARASGGSLTLGPTTLADNGRFVRAVATNPSGSVQSLFARLAVAPRPAAPMIQAGPAGLTVGTGGTATFDVVATGVPAVSIQWQVSVDNGATFANINGANAARLLQPALTLADDFKQFRAVVSNAVGTLTSAPALLRVLQGPAITLEPQDQAWRPGSTDALFTVAATGSNPTVQWQTSSDNPPATWSDVPGATGTSYLHAPNAAPAVRWVRAVVRNAVGSTFSRSALLSAMDWTHANPRPTGENLLDTAWVDGATLVAVGELQTILRSTDQGATWRIASESRWWGAAELRAVAFNGVGTGVAVGSSGGMKRSVDGGAHWVVVRRADSLSLNDIAFVDPSVAVAVGDRGALLRTIDAGANWAPAFTSSGGTTLRGVAFSAGGIGLAVGDGGTIVRSINGGVNWSRVASGSTRVLSTVAFASPTVAVAAGENGQFLRSTDAGLTWQPVASPTPFFVGRVHFASALVGAAATVQGSIVRTVDGGATWTQASPVLSHRYYSLRFGSTGVAVAVGGLGMIRRSTDGGATWSTVTAGPTDTVMGAAMAGPDIGVGVGTGGAIMRTTDAGLTWSTIVASSAGLPQLNGVAFADASVGVAVGQDGSALRTTDAGLTWSPVLTGTAQWLSAVSFGSPAVGVIATLYGMLRSADGGATWQAAAGPAGFMRAVAMRDANVGVAVGASGLVLRTVDGGRTWLSVPSGSTAELKGVAFATASTVVAVGANGAMLRSTDAGLTWNAQGMPLFSDYTFESVVFLNANVGLAVGTFSTVMQTRDGGLTWDAMTSQRVASLNSVVRVGAGGAMALGTQGVVLRNPAP